MYAIHYTFYLLLFLLHVSSCRWFPKTNKLKNWFSKLDSNSNSNFDKFFFFLCYCCCLFRPVVVSLGRCLLVSLLRGWGTCWEEEVVGEENKKFILPTLQSDITIVRQQNHAHDICTELKLINLRSWGNCLLLLGGAFNGQIYVYITVGVCVCLSFSVCGEYGRKSN